MDLIDRKALVNLLENERIGFLLHVGMRTERNQLSYIIKLVEEIPPVEIYSKQEVEQVMWERDMAVQRMNDYAVQLKEKADCVRVTRCKDCVHRRKRECPLYNEKYMEYDMGYGD